MLLETVSRKEEILYCGWTFPKTVLDPSKDMAQEGADSGGLKHLNVHPCGPTFRNITSEKEELLSGRFFIHAMTIFTTMAGLSRGKFSAVSQYVALHKNSVIAPEINHFITVWKEMFCSKRK